MSRIPKFNDAAKLICGMYYPKCIVSDFDSSVCEFAHIIPFEHAQKFNYKDIAYASENYIRLFRGLHHGFEICNGKIPTWTIRIDDARLDQPILYGKFEVYSFAHKRELPENKFRDNIIEVRKESEPYLRLHNAIFDTAWKSPLKMTPFNPILGTKELHNKLSILYKYWHDMNIKKYHKLEYDSDRENSPSPPVRRASSAPPRKTSTSSSTSAASASRKRKAETTITPVVRPEIIIPNSQITNSVISKLQKITNESLEDRGRRRSPRFCNNGNKEQSQLSSSGIIQTILTNSDDEEESDFAIILSDDSE